MDRALKDQKQISNLLHEREQLYTRISKLESDLKNKDENIKNFNEQFIKDKQSFLNLQQQTNNDYNKLKHYLYNSIDDLLIMIKEYENVNVIHQLNEIKSYSGNIDRYYQLKKEEDEQRKKDELDEKKRQEKEQFFQMYVKSEEFKNIINELYDSSYDRKS